MISKEIPIDVEAQDVYAALTTSHGIQSWLAKNALIGLKTGEEIKITYNKDRIPFDMQFKIEELVKDKKVLWGSTHNSNPDWLTTKITFVIAQVQNGSVINFIHSDFPKNYDCENENAFWDNCLQSLKKYCETGEGSPLV